MAKKFLVVLLALCVVFAMAGCGDKDPVDPGDGGGGIVKTVVLEVNREYTPTGDGPILGYQAKLTDIIKSKLVTGKKVKFTYAFTSDRDLPDGEDLQVLFVDTTEAGGWWEQLCGDGTDIEVPGKDTEVKGEVEFAITKDSTAASGEANAMVFQFKDTAASGKITLKFTEWQVNVE